MKKIVLLITAIAVTAAAAFAQEETGIKFSSWARGAFSPYGVAYTETQTGEKEDMPNVGAGDAGRDAVNVELYVEGSTSWIGFNLKLNNSVLSESDPDNSNNFFSNLREIGADVWIKPLNNDWLKIRIGKFSDGTLAGKIGDVNPGFQEFVYKPNGGGSNIFSDMNADRTGVVISSAPPLLPGLFAAIKLQSTRMWIKSTTPGWENVAWGEEAEKVFKGIQAAVGYEIEGIGHARLQYIGEREEFIVPNWIDSAKWYVYDGMVDYLTGRIEAAFAFTMIEGLILDLGAKFYMPLSFEDPIRVGVDNKPLVFNVTKSPVIALGASWNWNDLSFTGRVDTTLGSIIETRDFTGNSGFSLNAHLVPVWDFGFLKAGVDFGFSVKTTASVDKMIDALGDFHEEDPITGWGFGGFIQRNLGGNGWIKAGIAYNGGKKQGEKITQIPALSIPIVVETTF